MELFNRHIGVSFRFPLRCWGKEEEYSQVRDYLLPNITVPEEAIDPIGVWGQRHARYLKEHRKVLYVNLLTSGKLNAHLAEIDKQEEAMFYRLVKEMAEKQGVTEQLKATDQMARVQKIKIIP